MSFKRRVHSLNCPTGRMEPNVWKLEFHRWQRTLLRGFPWSDKPYFVHLWERGFHVSKSEWPQCVILSRRNSVPWEKQLVRITAYLHKHFASSQPTQCGARHGPSALCKLPISSQMVLKRHTPRLNLNKITAFYYFIKDILFFFLKFVYLFILRETARVGEGQRERERERDGESQAGSTLSAGSWMRVPNSQSVEIMTWAETQSQTVNHLSHPRAPSRTFLRKLFVCLFSFF